MQISQDTSYLVISQLPKRLMMVIKAKAAHVESYLDYFCVQMIIAVTSLYVQIG